MNITLNTNVKAVNFDGDISQIKSIVDADTVMHQLTDLLNTKLMTVKLSGAWFIMQGELGKHAVIAGDQARGQKRRSKFSLALTDALNSLGYTVVSLVPFK